MANVKVNKSFGFNMTKLDFSSLFQGANYVQTSSLFRVTYGSGQADEFRGRGFKYDDSGEPIGGTVKSYAVLYLGLKIATVDGLSIAATSIVAAARTYGKGDDYRVIAKALDGRDVMKGGNGNDVLLGYDGNDLLVGSRGNDALIGGKGKDKIVGGFGADRLSGDSGKDTFVFNKVADSTARSFDTIEDFSKREADIIDLKSIDANAKAGGNQAFKFIGNSDFNDKAGELRFQKAGGDTYVLGDTNGDGAADFALKLNPVINLDRFDFLL